VDAFDADVLIYAAVSGHPLGRRIVALLPEDPPAPTDPPAGIGSLLLLPELLSKPLRDGAEAETLVLSALLARLELRPVDRTIAKLAVALAAEYHLKAADAVHLATAVNAGADRFVTNNRRHFSRNITEVEVTYPDDLAG